MELIKTKLSKLKDNEEFQLSKRSNAAIYTSVRKEKNYYVFSSVLSERSFKRLGSTVVYVIRS